MDTSTSFLATETTSSSSPGAGSYNIPGDDNDKMDAPEEDSKFKEKAAEEADSNVTDLQMLLIEDSTFDKVPPHLENLLLSFDVKETKPPDLLIALIYGLAIECSYASIEEVSTKLHQLDLRSYISTFHIRNIRLLSTMPQKIYDSNKMVYTLRLQLIYDETATVCLLTGIVTGDFLILTLTPDCPDGGGKSICLSIGRYVLNSKRTSFSSRFRKLHELSFKMREQVLIPIRNQIIRNECRLFLYPGLDGLPDELYLHLYTYLKINCLNKLSNVSKRFRDTVSYYKFHISKIKK